jgi:Predicted transcriptional regulator
MSEDRGRLRWNVQRRLIFIELRLYWEGRINRGDLVDYFDISVPQASQDLARYEEIAPGNLHYDKTLKTYVAGPNFRPVLTEPTADGYLAQLRALGTGGLGPGESWLGRAPDFAGAPRLRRHYEPEVLRRLLRCIQDRLELKVRYLSFSADEASARTIAPHALGFDGQRWHVRAFCFRTMSFRDFVIGRLSHLGDAVPTSAQAAWDLEWTEKVEMRLIANPRLQPAMRSAVERDVGMRQGVLPVTTTVCSSYYLESQLNLDLDPELLPAKRLQLVLHNRDEVAARRSEVKAAAEKVIRAAGPQPAT